MRNILKSTLFFALALTFSTVEAQNSLNEGTIDQQFEFLYNKSSSWQDYKMTKKGQLNKFYSNVSDTLTQMKSNVSTLNKTIAGHQKEVDDLNNKIETLSVDLERATKEKNSFSVFGFLMNKNTYNTILWGLILGLAAILGFYVFRFNRSHIHTKKARNLLDKTKTEFDAFRQKTLEKEQVLMRQLQDELNKNAMNV